MKRQRIYDHGLFFPNLYPIPHLGSCLDFCCNHWTIQVPTEKSLQDAPGKTALPARGTAAFIINEMPSISFLSLVLFLSGFAALSFEICFARILLRLLGSGSQASACVFAAFMTGSALGALTSAKYPGLLLKLAGNNRIAKVPDGPAVVPDLGCKGEPRQYLQAYGVFQLLSAICIFLLLPLSEASLSQNFALMVFSYSLPSQVLDLLRFLIAFFLLLLPSYAMGAGFSSLLLGLDQIRERSKSAASAFGFLYSANTAGAALGAVASAFYLLPHWGLFKSTCFSAAASILVYLLCRLDSLRKDNPVTSESSKDLSPLPSASNSAIPALVLSSLSGALCLLFELSWTRIYSLLLGSSSYSLAVILLMVLTACSAGALFTEMIAPDRASIRKYLAGAFLLFGLSCSAGIYLSNLFYWLFIETASFLSPIFSADPFTRSIISRSLLSFLFVFIPCFFLAQAMPLCARLASSPPDTGKLYSANSFGSAAASLLFPPALGIAGYVSGAALQTILLAISIISLAASAIIMGLNLRPAGIKEKLLSSFLIALSLAAMTFLVLKRPVWSRQAMSRGILIGGNELNQAAMDRKADEEELLFYAEGINSTVSVESNRAANCVSLKADGKVEATLPLDMTLISPGSDFATHTLLSALPLIFHEKPCKSAFLVGLGSGLSAGTLLSFPEIKELRVAELEPEMLSACRHLSSYNLNPLSAGKRIQVQLQDARFVLAGSRASYDLIISQAADPWVCGAADLYTLEFWQLAASRLNQGGIFCQWLQLYAIPESELESLIFTLNKVFGNVYICHSPGAGEILLLCSQEELLKNPAAFISSADARIKASNNKYLGAAGLNNAFDAASLIVAGPRQLKSRLQSLEPPPQASKDDLPFIEYATSRSLLGGKLELEANLSYLLKLACPDKPYIPDLSQSKEESCRRGLNYALLARAYLRQGSGEPSAALKELNQERALACCMYSEKESSGKKCGPARLWHEYVVLRALEKVGEAKQHADMLLRMQAESDDDRLALFDYFFDSGNRSKAKSLLDYFETADLQERSLRRGVYFLAEDEPGKSLKELSKLWQEPNRQAKILLPSSYAALKSGELELADKLFAEYLSTNPWDGKTQLSYTNLLCLKNETEKALLHAQSAVKLRPSDPSPYVLLLASALESGKMEIARTMLAEISSSQGETASRFCQISDGKALDKMKEDKEFRSLISKLREKAEDAKNGYKVLGEP